MQRRATIGTPEIEFSAMLDLRPEAAAPDPKDSFSIVTHRCCSFGPSIECSRGLDVLVAEKLSNDLVLARIAIKKDLRRSMSKAMCRHLEPSIGIDKFANLAA